MKHDLGCLCAECELDVVFDEIFGRAEEKSPPQQKEKVLEYLLKLDLFDLELLNEEE